VDAAVARLDQIDARYLMPEVLNVSAQMLYARGERGPARAQAEQALALAVSVDRPLEAARAHAVLACVAAQDGSREDAFAHVDAAQAAGSDQLSAGARAWLRNAERMLARQQS
jgi:hypothetical protein